LNPISRARTGTGTTKAMRKAGTQTRKSTKSGTGTNGGKLEQDQHDGKSGTFNFIDDGFQFDDD
jgi:hypothetical protein